MSLENQLVDAAMMWGADYHGVADLSAAQDTILEQRIMKKQQYVDYAFLPVNMEDSSDLNATTVEPGFKS